jgi:hypothetical protein
VRQQSGNALNPTPIQFQRAFKKLLLLHFFNHSESYNCADEDFENTLKDNVATTTGLLFGAPIVTETQSFNTTLDQVVTDLQELPTKNCYTWLHLQQMLK